MGYHNGLGFPMSCDQDNEAFLLEPRGADKFAIATAATITALIPILVSVQRLPTANIHELVLRDYRFLAIVTAGLTFGLPVAQKSSNMIVKASDYLRDDIWTNEDGRTGHRPTRRSEYMFNGVFAVLQALVIVTPALLNYIIKSYVRTLWGCHGSAHILWLLGFLLPIPFVGIVQYYFLRWTHYTPGGTKTDGLPIVYYRAHQLYPIVDLLPGLAQMFMTMYFTFLFSTIYGVSVKAALLRVMIVAIFIFFSRVVSLWFARAASERHSKLLVRCESEKQAAAVLNHRPISNIRSSSRHGVGP